MHYFVHRATITIQSFVDFSISASTGTIYTRKTTLDYEDKNQCHTCEVRVSVSDGTFSVETTVYIKLLDINDNSPVFNQMRYSKEMTDNVTAGDTVIYVCLKYVVYNDK